MIIQAERNNKRLFVVKQNRFNPPVAALKQLIVNGDLGKIYLPTELCFWNRNEDYYKDSERNSDMDGGTFHSIQPFHWICCIGYLVT